METRVLLVDPQPIVRRGLAAAIGAEPDLLCIGDAEDAFQASIKARRLRPDVILTEQELPDGDAAHLCASIAGEGLAARVLVLSGVCAGDVVYRTVAAGAVGYLSKREPVERICSAIRRAAEGQPAFSDDAQTALQRFLHHQAQAPDALSVGAPTRPLLTERERQVLQCIADGISVEETGRRLHASSSTIKNYRQSIFAKLNVPNAPAAVYEAMHRGIIA